jgi:hypothetical protein
MPKIRNANEQRPAVWLTKQQVADRLGKSIKTIQGLVSRGYLHPVLKNGHQHFSPPEVEALARPGRRPSPWLAGPSRGSVHAAAGSRSEGKEAAYVFRLLSQNKSLREIVIRAQVPPSRVRALHREWRLSVEDKHDAERDMTAPAIDETFPIACALSPELARYDDPNLQLDIGDGPELDTLGAAAQRLFDENSD